MITSLPVGNGGLGRFGNTCFSIASTMGIARRSGQPFAFPRWRTVDNEIFNQPIDDIQSMLVNPLPEIPNIHFQTYPYFWGYRDINLPEGNWNIHAHLQSERYFKHCIDEVRHYFTFKDEPEQNDFVAIHYRAGDYIDDPNAYHPRCTDEYYKQAVEHFPGQKFLLFTDDVEEGLRKFARLGIEVEIAGGSYMCDFKEMKKCKSFITANSSFSLMASILGNHPEKRIVCPSRWFGPHVDLETKDLYPENAIVI